MAAVCDMGLLQVVGGQRAEKPKLACSNSDTSSTRSCRQHAPLCDEAASLSDAVLVVPFHRRLL